MSSHVLPDCRHWSTDSVRPSRRFDYYADALASAVAPMQVSSRRPSQFSATMTAIDVAGLSVLYQTGTTHRSFRATRDTAKVGEHTYHLIVNLNSAWTLAHRGTVNLQAGDAVLADSRYPHDLELPSDYRVVHLKFRKEWLIRWLPNPEPLVGRRLAANSNGVNALTTFLACLSPRVLINAPVSPQVVVDQIGVLIAMLGREESDDRGRAIDLRGRVLDCITQRCPEPELTAEEVARSLDLPIKVVHGSLTAAGGSFPLALRTARSHLATRMLMAPSFNALSQREIAARAGFTSVHAMTRALRAPTSAVLPRLPERNQWRRP